MEDKIENPVEKDPDNEQQQVAAAPEGDEFAGAEGTEQPQGAVEQQPDPQTVHDGPAQGENPGEAPVHEGQQGPGAQYTVPPMGAEQPQGQPQQPGVQYQLPPGYAIDPATGQPVFVGQVYQQPPHFAQPGVVYVQQQPSPEEIAAQQAAAQQRYAQVVQSVESFLEGDATVSDVVKTLYVNTSQDDQLWKGVLVGAAAAFLLTSGPVKEVMGKTFSGVFPGVKDSKTETDDGGEK